jgi:hypothetical protein
VSKFNTARFETFLRKLLRYRSRNRRTVMVLDNAAALQYPRVLALLFLPRMAHSLLRSSGSWPRTTLDELVVAVTSCYDRRCFELCGPV